MTRENTELAGAIERLTDMADWTARGDPGAEGSILMAATVAAEHSSDIRLILSAVSAAPLHEGDWSELERLANEATPGPWRAFFAANGSLLGVGKQDGEGVTDYRGGLWGMEPEANANAAFIAAANPETILKLIVSARAASVEVELLAVMKEAQQNWHHMIGLSSPTEHHRLNERMSAAIAKAEALSRKQEPGVPTPGGEG